SICVLFTLPLRLLLFLFLHHTPPTQISTLSLHDALPISRLRAALRLSGRNAKARSHRPRRPVHLRHHRARRAVDVEGGRAVAARSEEHTSELQSLTNLVCRLLLEKKKSNHITKQMLTHTP